MSVYGSNTGHQKIKKVAKDFAELFSYSKNGMAKYVNTQKLFPTIFKKKKLWCICKPFFKIIDILFLMVRFAKSSGQTIIQIIRKKSVLMFSINPSNGFAGTYLKPPSKMKVFVVLLVCGLKT